MQIFVHLSDKTSAVLNIKNVKINGPYERGDSI